MRIRTLGSIAAAAMLMSGSAANALTFNLINTGGAEEGTTARAGFDAAAAYWSSVLTNNVTVNLEIGFQSLGEGILGSTGSTRADVSLNSVVNALATTGNSQLDAIALATLQSKVSNGSIAAITNTPLFQGLGVNATQVEYDNDGSQNNSYIWGNTAVLKAMGLTENEFYGGSFADVVDGEITFSSDFDFDFDASDGIDDGYYDFVGVAIHEIGHALGFVSGVDLYDYYGYPDGPGWPDGAFSFDNPGGGLMSTLDLFRYSSDPTGVAPGGGASLDWSVGTASFFSINGATQVFGNSGFSTGSYNGDGRQASHWKAPGGCTNLLGIMNPYLCDGTPSVVTKLDLAAFDAMGWNLNIDVLAPDVPEASSWAMMILGMGAIGGALRRRRVTVSFGSAA